MSDKKYNVLCGDDCLHEGMTKEQILSAIFQAVTTGEIQDIDAGFITKIKELNSGVTLSLWLGSKAQFNALAERPKNCICFFTDDTIEEDLFAAIEANKKAIEATAADMLANNENNKTKYRALRGAEPIPQNADLNTYLTVGNYTAQNSTHVATYLNCPVDVSFRLTVENLLGEAQTVSASGYDFFLQTIRTIDGQELTRAVRSNGNTIIFDEWKCIEHRVSNNEWALENINTPQQLYKGTLANLNTWEEIPEIGKYKAYAITYMINHPLKSFIDTVVVYKRGLSSISDDCQAVRIYKDLHLDGGSVWHIQIGLAINNSSNLVRFEDLKLYYEGELQETVSGQPEILSIYEIFGIC